MRDSPHLSRMSLTRRFIFGLSSSWLSFSSARIVPIRKACLIKETLRHKVIKVQGLVNVLWWETMKEIFNTVLFVNKKIE